MPIMNIDVVDVAISMRYGKNFPIRLWINVRYVVVQ